MLRLHPPPPLHSARARASLRLPPAGLLFNPSPGLPCPLKPLFSTPTNQVFDFDRWKKHRSSSRYMRHMAGMFSSSVVRNVEWKKGGKRLLGQLVGAAGCRLAAL